MRIYGVDCVKFWMNATKLSPTSANRSRAAALRFSVSISSLFSSTFCFFTSNSSLLITSSSFLISTSVSRVLAIWQDVSRMPFTASAERFELVTDSDGLSSTSALYLPNWVSFGLPTRKYWYVLDVWTTNYQNQPPPVADYYRKQSPCYGQTNVLLTSWISFAILSLIKTSSHIHINPLSWRASVSQGCWLGCWWLGCW